MQDDTEFEVARAACENQIDLSVCNGCDECFLRCATGVPSSRNEWEVLQHHLATLSQEQREHVTRIEAQDKSVDLGDGVTVTLCRYRDMERGGCAVYPARPLVCRLLGHVEWMPCPIEKVPKIAPTHVALKLMQVYSRQERKTFEEWEALGTIDTIETIVDGGLK